MSKKNYTCWIALLTLVAFAASDLFAQGGRRRRGGRRMPRQVTPPPKPEKKKDSKPKSYLAIKNADVYIGTGQRIRNCDILIADDKIEKVGPGIEIPKEAKIIDAESSCQKLLWTNTDRVCRNERLERNCRSTSASGNIQLISRTRRTRNRAVYTKRSNLCPRPQS